jgi:hypothetical protein
MITRMTISLQLIKFCIFIFFLFVWYVFVPCRLPFFLANLHFMDYELIFSFTLGLNYTYSA